MRGVCALPPGAAAAEGVVVKVMKLVRVAILAAALSTFVAGTASAANITVDQFLYDGTIANSTLLLGPLDMTFSGGGTILTITLTNLLSDSAGDGAGNLLTGIDFQLPDIVGILSGSVSAPLVVVNYRGARPATRVAEPATLALFVIPSPAGVILARRRRTSIQSS